MTSNDDRDLKQWTADWQAAPYDVESAEQIRHYVKQRTGFFWSLAVADFVIGGIALPVLVYLGVYSGQMAERAAMAGLASITVAAVMFGWWNRRGVLRSSATTVAEYVAISAERLRRMHMAWRIGWVVLAAEGVLFPFWIWSRLYSGPTAPPPGAERFAWSWFSLFMVMGLVGLIWFGRWLKRDAARFEALRRDLADKG
jgi:hypothetical protein